jgi:hypothetical protein
MRFRQGHALPKRSRTDNYIKDCATNCWVWQGKRVAGYGYTYVKRRAVRAHRFYYELYRGPIPDGCVLDHLCRNPSCVNPAHLEAVSHTTNVRRSRAAKLTLELAEEIRAAYGPGTTMAALAEQYGVSSATICDIIHRKLWT